jgi:hypothetical protein
MARCIRPLRVLVKEAAACRKIQQRGARQYRQCALRRRCVLGMFSSQEVQVLYPT